MEKVNPKSVIRISHCRTTPRNPNDRFGLKAESNMDIFEKDLSGAMVSPDEPGYDQLISTIFDTMATAAEMNAKGWLSPEEVYDYLHRITGREIDPSTTLLPPFYVDYGKNTRIGKGCWIQQGCTFLCEFGIKLKQSQLF